MEAAHNDGTKNIAESENIVKNAEAQAEASSNIFTQNCSSTAEATKLISDVNYRDDKTTKCPSIIAFRMKVDGEFDPHQAKLPKKQKFDFEKAFLVSFESADGSQMILYWKNKDSSDFCGLPLADDDIKASVKLFTLEFIVGSLADSQTGEKMRWNKLKL
jgi:hypothetical protein